MYDKHHHITRKTKPTAYRRGHSGESTNGSAWRGRFLFFTAAVREGWLAGTGYRRGIDRRAHVALLELLSFPKIYPPFRLSRGTHFLKIEC